MRMHKIVATGDVLKKQSCGIFCVKSDYSCEKMPVCANAIEK